MHWNHRLVQLDIDCIRVQEVYYNDKDEPESYSDTAIQGETIEEAIRDLERIKSAFSKPILQLSDFKKKRGGPAQVNPPRQV